MLVGNAAFERNKLLFQRQHLHPGISGAILRLGFGNVAVYALNVLEAVRNKIFRISNLAGREARKGFSRLVNADRNHAQFFIRALSLVNEVLAQAVDADIALGAFIGERAIFGAGKQLAVHIAAGQGKQLLPALFPVHCIERGQTGNQPKQILTGNLRNTRFEIGQLGFNVVNPVG